MNSKITPCNMLEEYLDTNLSKSEHTRFAAHLAECNACREQVRVSEQLRAHYSQSRNTELPDEADLRIRIALRRDLWAQTPAKDVMNLEEAATWLGVTPGVLAERLDEIPFFEIGGRIRFSRTRLEQWIDMKDNELSLQIQRAQYNNDKKLLHFPGGKHGKQDKPSVDSGVV